MTDPVIKVRPLPAVTLVQLSAAGEAEKTKPIRIDLCSIRCHAHTDEITPRIERVEGKRRESIDLVVKGDDVMSPIPRRGRAILIS